jgi:hypothetical protein
MMASVRNTAQTTMRVSTMLSPLAVMSHDTQEVGSKLSVYDALDPSSHIVRSLSNILVVEDQLVSSTHPPSGIGARDGNMVVFDALHDADANASPI